MKNFNKITVLMMIGFFIAHSAFADLSADFSATPTSGIVLLTVNFTDLSIGNPTCWEWDFQNDGIIDSYDQNPEWIYNETGVYTVSLTISNGKNEDTETKVNYIVVVPTTITADYGTPSVPNTWENFTIPLTADTFGVAPPIFQYILANVQQFRIKTEMSYVPDDGCIDSIKIGNVYLSTFNNNTEGWSAAGDGTIQWIPDGGYNGGYIKINDWATGDWHWAVAPVEWADDWTELIGSNIEFYYKNNHPVISAVIEITCAEVDRLILSANPLIIPQNDSSLMKIALSHTSAGDVIVNLNSSSTNCITVPAQVVIPANESFVEFYIYATEGATIGCNSVITASANDYGVSCITLSVGEEISPIAEFLADITFGNVPLTVNFTDLSTGNPISWEWDFQNDGIIDSYEQNPQCIYTLPGLYSVSLTVSDGETTDTEVKYDYINVSGIPHYVFEGGDPSNDIWTIYLGGGAIEGVDLQTYDEIAIFDGIIMVGLFVLDEVLTMENAFDNSLIAFSQLYTQPGYQPGNSYSFKCWDASEQVETDNFEIELFNPYGDAYTGDVFPYGDAPYSIASLDFGSTASQTFSLEYGFQFISSGVIPNEPDMIIVMDDVLNDNLDYVRNSLGQTLRKIGPNWVNGIGDWIVEEGYLVKMFASDSFTINGALVDPTTPIPVETGFQFVSYFPETSMDALIAFETIIGADLNFIRNTQGQTLRKIGPNWVNGIGDCFSGEGYLVKMFAEGEIIYPAAAKSSSKITALPTHFNFEGGNAAYPVFTIYVEGLEIGDEVATYDGDIMIGAMKVNSENAFDNDLPVFSIINSGKGFKPGTPIILKAWDASSQSLIPFESSMIDPYNEAYMEEVYPEEDGLYSIFKITKGINVIGTDNKSISIYPNPSEGIFNISIEGVSGKIQMKVFDVHGNNYNFFELQSTGNLTEKLDLKDLAAGVYFISFSGKDFSRIKKIVIQ